VWALVWWAEDLCWRDLWFGGGVQRAVWFCPCLCWGDCMHVCVGVGNGWMWWRLIPLSHTFRRMGWLQVRGYFGPVLGVCGRIVCCALGTHFIGSWVQRAILAVTFCRVGKPCVLSVPLACCPYLSLYGINMKGYVFWLPVILLLVCVPGCRNSKA
jgi:hypothetical protein